MEMSHLSGRNTHIPPAFRSRDSQKSFDDRLSPRLAATTKDAMWASFGLDLRVFALSAASTEIVLASDDDGDGSGANSSRPIAHDGETPFSSYDDILVEEKGGIPFWTKLDRRVVANALAAAGASVGASFLVKCGGEFVPPQLICPQNERRNCKNNCICSIFRHRSFLLETRVHVHSVPL